jgi:ADP-ribose pyrophosphatase
VSDDLPIHVQEDTLSEDLVSSRRIYEGRVVSLRLDTVRLRNGRLAEREVVEHGGAVATVALNEANNVLLVNQFRAAVGTRLLELPAGTIEAGEKAEACALRELREETGYTASHIEELYTFYTSPGFCNERICLYLATGLRSGGQSLESDESIEVVEVSLKSALEMIESGEIRDGKTILGLIAAGTRMRTSRLAG